MCSKIRCDEESYKILDATKQGLNVNPPEVEDTCVTAYGQNKAKQARQKKKLRFQHETSKYWFSSAVLLFSGIICTPPPA